MKNFRRNFLKLFGLSFLSTIVMPYNLLYALTKKIINPNLTEEQKKLCLMSLLKDHLAVL